METIKILTGEEAIEAVKALNDENRRQILHALRARQMTTSELCEFLDSQDPDKEVKSQTVRYHLKELEKCKLIQQVGYEPAGNGDSHIMQKLWRATAENVFIATGDMELMPERASHDLDRALDIVSTMEQLGMKFTSEKELETVADDFAKRDQIYIRGLERAKENLREVCEIDPKLYVVFRRILSVVRLNDQDYKEYWDVSKRITDTLRDAYKRGKGKNPEVY